MAQGIGIWMGGQAFINMGVNLGVLPTKGLTLPLMSYGGSAILMNLVALAIVLRVDIENRAADARRPRMTRCTPPCVDDTWHGAGTGGHVIPGPRGGARDAARAAGASAGWARASGMENRLVPPERGIALDRIGFTGLRGKGLLHTLTGGAAPAQARSGDCLGILRRRGADAVLGMGGYVCFPGGLMASLLGKPLVLVNADASLLLSNKALLPVADRVAFGFDGAAAARTQAGRGHRQPGARRDRGAARAGRALCRPQRRAALLVVGGSLGARVLNDMRAAALALMPPAQRPRVTHQTGSAHIDAVRAAYRDAGVEAEVLPFIDDMAARLAACDVIVCRAGAVTVSELCAAGVRQRAGAADRQHHRAPARQRRVHGAARRGRCTCRRAS